MSKTLIYKLFGIFLFLFLILVMIVSCYSITLTNIDEFLLYKIQNVLYGIPVFVPFIISEAGYEFYMLPQIAIVSFFLIKIKKIKDVILLFLGTELTFILSGLLKIFIQRPRPSDLYKRIVETGYSFPSGHSTINTFFFLMIIYFICTYIHNRILKIILCILSVLWVLLVMLSRLCLGVHYPSDILGGFLIGLIMFFVFMLINQKIK